jgi:aminocarboxymuconate-semialdehyde decarboxylase
MMGQEKMQKYWLPWLVGMPAETSRAICSMIFGGVFEHFPKLRVAFAHGGGSFPFTIGRIEHGFDSRPDLVAIDNNITPRNYLGKFWFDSLVHDKMALKYLVELAGANRVALGSDYPFPLGEDVPGTLIKEAGFDLAIQQQLLSGSALEWMGLEAKRFV